MKHNTIFQGVATALATPMTSTGVDYEALGRLIDFQLESGINALVAVGTTGESATLTPAERNEIIRFTVERVNGRVPVIAGTGTNNTLHALEYSKTACQIGADALLVVTPYYTTISPWTAACWRTSAPLQTMWTSPSFSITSPPAPAATCCLPPLRSWQSIPTSLPSRKPAAT